MALTATPPAEQSEELITHYLKNPVVIKSTVNRPNIKLYVGQYDFKTEKTPSSKKESAASASDNMAIDEDDLGEEDQGVNATSQGLKADKPSVIISILISKEVILTNTPPSTIIGALVTFLSENKPSCLQKKNRNSSIPTPRFENRKFIYKGGSP